MNLFDQAQDIEMREREHNIAQALRAAPVIQATGNCLYCSQELAAGLRFCDAECCRAWEAEQAAWKRSGKTPQGVPRPSED